MVTLSMAIALVLWAELETAVDRFPPLEEAA